MEETKVWVRRKNEEVISIIEDSDMMKNKRINWVGHVWRGREQIIGQVTNWKLRIKRPLGRPRKRWIVRVHKDLAILGILNGEELATDKDRWRGGDYGEGPKQSILSQKYI